MQTIGIDLGGTKMSAGRVDGSGRILERIALARPADAEDMAKAPIELAASLMTPDVAAIGLGAAGLVTWPEGRLVWGPNVAGEQIPFTTLLDAAFGVPVVVDNDANLAALAEVRLGVARGLENVVMITLGTGIGGGLVIGGEVYRGASFAGEVGHMVVDVGGPSCTCGQRGCWETFASGRRLDQMARDAAADHPSGLIARLAQQDAPSGIHLTEAAVRGDAAALALMEETGIWLGVGIASLVAILDPEMVVVGGGASRAGDALLEPARRSLASTLEGATHRAPTPIAAAALGEDAGLVGAGLAALEVANG